MDAFNLRPNILRIILRSPDTLLKMNSPAVRSELVEALKLDLVGPDNDHAFAHELLPDAPSRWYSLGLPRSLRGPRRPEDRRNLHRRN